MEHVKSSCKTKNNCHDELYKGGVGVVGGNKKEKREGGRVQG